MGSSCLAPQCVCDLRVACPFKAHRDDLFEVSHKLAPSMSKMSRHHLVVVSPSFTMEEKQCFSTTYVEPRYQLRGHAVPTTPNRQAHRGSRPQTGPASSRAHWWLASRRARPGYPAQRRGNAAGNRCTAAGLSPCRCGPAFPRRVRR